MNVLILGKKPQRSDPTLTFARRMVEAGVACRFSGGVESTSTRAWLRLFRGADVVLISKYGGVSNYGLRQLELALAGGCILVRRWAGSDVQACLANPMTRRRALLLDKLVTLNITPAPHLVSELNSIGITAQVTPCLVDSESAHPQCPFVPRSILVYLPATRRSFYGGDLVERVVASNADIEFSIVADDTHSLKDFSNVRSFGWTDNMEPVWSGVGGLLRVTEHDGMPRMVLDALLRRKYVMYSWPLQGCELVKNEGDVQNAIERFKIREAPNQDGPLIARQFLDLDAPVKIRKILQDVVDQQSRIARLKHFSGSIGRTIRMRLGVRTV